MLRWNLGIYARSCLTKKRVQRGISAEEMCKRVPGLDEQTLRLIETQRRSIGPAWRWQIAVVLQLPPEDLFHEPFPEQPIEISIYEPHPDMPGYVLQAGRKTVRQVYDELVQRLKNDDMLPEYRFSICVSAKDIAEEPFPEHRWIACFAVRGDSEGHCIHVEVIAPGGNRKLLYLGKTLQGLARAQAIANACGAHLEW